MATAQPTERHEEIQFRQLLEEAVTKPGPMDAPLITIILEGRRSPCQDLYPVGIAGITVHRPTRGAASRLDSAWRHAALERYRRSIPPAHRFPGKAGPHWC